MKIKTTYTLFESLNGSINYVEYGKQHKENYFEFTGSLSGGLTIQEMANVMEKAIKVSKEFKEITDYFYLISFNPVNARRKCCLES